MNLISHGLISNLLQLTKNCPYFSHDFWSNKLLLLASRPELIIREYFFE